LARSKTHCEVLSLAIAVVTTDVPGCRKTVTDLINGRLVSRRECIYAPDAVAGMGAASGERMLARSSAARINSLWLALLRECLT
jgi:hypothetical protein